MAKISIIICTHNPRADALKRVMGALERQTLVRDLWELLLIDNASAQPLAQAWDLSWHPQGRHVREEGLGLTRARLRGIAEAQGDVIVFVDDDNVLASDYLAHVQAIAAEFPRIGAWGGHIEAEYAAKPEPWLREFERMLAIIPVEQDIRTDSFAVWQAVPCGAGLCVRRTVAEAYAKATQDSSRRLALDRKGTDTAGSGDLDLALTALDQGLEVGRFARLRMVHLISAQRCTVEYIERLAEGTAASLVYLASVRDPNAGYNWRNPRLIDRWRAYWRFRKMEPNRARVLRAQARGDERAYRQLAKERALRASA